MWLRSINIRNCRHLREVNINLAPCDNPAPLTKPTASFKHLVLTGPNGSGKSSVLKAIHAYICLLHGTSVSDDEHCIAKGTWISGTPSIDSKLVYSGLFSPHQLRTLESPDGATSISLSKSLGPSETIGFRIEQFLVNRRVQEALLYLSGDNEKAKSVGDWFRDFEDCLRKLFQSEQLKLQFDHEQLRFRLNTGNGNWTYFQELADGHRYLFGIFAELFARSETLPFQLKYNASPPGIVLIDEPECHLHLELQLTVLPFFARTFPSIQFIIATHSPLVVSSLPNSVVLDLRHQIQTDGVDVSTQSFGSLVTSLFGLESEYSEETQLKLDRLKVLSEQQRNQSMEHEYVSLLTELSAKSHTLALSLWAKYLAKDRG